MTATQETHTVIDIREAPSIALPPRPDAPPPAVSAPPRSESDVATIVSRGLAVFSLLVAAMLVFLFVLSGLPQARAQTGLRRRFAADVDTLRAPIGGVIAPGAPVAEIDIPAIGLRQIVVQGTTSGILRAGPGHLRQSPLPGQQGNAVIFGRRESYGAPFRHINSLVRGDRIQVWTGEGKRVYIVDSVHDDPATDGASLIGIGKNQLTLVTSNPPYVASRRLAVTSHLVGKPFAASADSTPVTRAELGLTGDTSGLLELALWLELLLIVAIGATWLWRRWTRWSAYVVCVPIVLAVTWIVFENITKLLPATL